MRGTSTVSLLALWAFCFASLAAADERFMQVPRSEIERIIERCCNLEEDADSLVEGLIETYPESPVGHFIKCSQLYWISYYAGVPTGFERELEDSLKAFARICAAWERSHPGDRDGLFMTGICEASQARFHIDQGHWARAFFAATAGLGKMRRVLKDDPNYYDAKLTLGLANCYLSEAPGYLKPFAFLMRFKGDLDTGLKQLESAKRAALFSRQEATLYLAVVHWELRDDREAAAREIDELLEAYPRNVKYQTLRARLDFRGGRPAEAYARLLPLEESGRLEAYPKIHVESLLTLTQIALNEGRLEEALEFGQRAETACGDFDRLRRPRAWSMLLRGIALRRLGRLDEAIRMCRRIERSDNPGAHDRAQALLRELELADGRD